MCTQILDFEFFKNFCSVSMKLVYLTSKFNNYTDTSYFSFSVSFWMAAYITHFYTVMGKLSHCAVL